MFFHRITSPKRQKRLKIKNTDLVSEQVRKLMQTADQKIILMVRG